jgi:RNA-directed DNA polymerase
LARCMRRDWQPVDGPTSHYHHRWVAKRSGERRLLEIPKQELKALQRKILSALLLPYATAHPDAFGFVRGRGVLDHARRHIGANWLLGLDLRDWFSSIVAARVHVQFVRLGATSSVANALTKLCTHVPPNSVLAKGDLSGERSARLRIPHLPQGAPTSPMLANLVSHRLDQRLHALAAKLDLRYSRYADDLALSPQPGSRARSPVRVAELVKRIALIESFAINDEKTRIQTALGRLYLTGVVINERPNLARPQFDQLKARIHRYRQSAQADDEVRAQLRGEVAWLTQLNPARGEKLRRQLEGV